MLNRRTPFGFYVAALCAVVFGLMMARAALMLASLTDRDTALIRASALLLAALSAVAAEALLAARPWAYRASVALAATYAALVVINFGVQGGMSGVVGSLWLLIPSAAVVGPLVAYVRERSADLFGTAAQPRPRPVAAAAARGRWIAPAVTGAFAPKGPAARAAGGRAHP
jgi:hypothetical protein